MKEVARPGQSTGSFPIGTGAAADGVEEDAADTKDIEIARLGERLAEATAVNQRLQDQNVELSRTNDDIQQELDSANAIADMVSQPFLILDGELRVEKANIAFYATFQMTLERTRDWLLSEIGNGQWAQPGLLATLKNMFVNGTVLENLEIDAEFPDIGFRSMSLNARRLRPERSSRDRILLAIQDCTELKRSERGRDVLLSVEHHARKRAEGADQLKDEFVATISHELRGPLTVISGWTNILLAAGDNPDTATLARALAAIGRGVAAQNRLISDLLDHSRIVAGKVEIQRTSIDVLIVAEAALVGVRAAAEAKAIDLQLSGDHGTCIVLGDFDRMQQVLWNLFLNAIKFTPPGGRVRISVARVANQVRASVTDTGCGITEEFLPHVFERFRQAESIGNRTQPGLGLGLALVRELVELHGGTVHAKSEGKDEGATFTVVLPIPALLLPAPAAERPPSLAAPFAPRGNLLEGTKVLVVDDEADARDALVALLERYGAHVRPAASVGEALAALKADLPDVLVSDLGMPVEDGYELIRRVRLLPADAGGQIPSLAVSAFATNEHREKVARSGFQKHLEKPVAPAELVTEVARLAGRLNEARA